MFIAISQLVLTIVAQELTQSNLPIIVINTFSREIPDEPKITAHMGIINNENQPNHISDPFNEYDGYIGIETRGSSSQMFPKKSYSIETRDEIGNNLNV
ncbi:MAG: spore coat protein CotH, partial [Candidatus Neomarinimicrobiota bacterium]